MNKTSSVEESSRIQVKDFENLLKVSHIDVTASSKRLESERLVSPSWFIRRLNPISRFIGALLLCLPMFVTLDIVSASIAFGLDILLFAIAGVTPWYVLSHTWPVWIAASGSFISVLLYGQSSGDDIFKFGWMHISQGSLYLAICTFVRVASVAVPGVILAIGLDPTDLADGLVQILHFSPRFVYGALAGLRMFSLLQNDWRAFGLARRSRGISDGKALQRMLSQSFGLLVLSIRRGTKLATAMEARAFGSNIKRVPARKSKLTAYDWIFYAICIAVPTIALYASIQTGYWHNAFIHM
ncbi:cobalt ABC transporter permease [Gardnerella vaginalis]|uniref:Energy-coupling factor transporter transmembrane protein EcfT n=1 Tax=Gardnerella piotii TaxID=2792977 RepID=A0ABU5MR91_9BIFI|nr:energy-coupling factor transporter transmembrane component T [Gardnerella piotii]MDZ7544955.1 energy-coupling factor transporter transmembrane protein EcfT [Gardnerella piotii]MDZ7552799.1 energy-coupling factor transporter transmembrane protein EcfT [Gardnerella piotii]RFT26413.1 cobalt ABC transporter permease [Gardnerella vaginalis]